MARTPDRWPLTRAALIEVARAGLVGLRRFARGAGRARVPGRLLFAPQDLRSADPAFADDAATGLYVFADQPLALGRTSPFAANPPSPEWERELRGFGWLRHLRAAGTPEAHGLARALVADAMGRRWRDLEGYSRRAPEVTARRVTSLLAHSPLLLAGADHAFYRGYLRRIGRDAAALDRDMRDAPAPADRLAAAIGLAAAGLACEGLEGRFRRADRVLAAELDAQILPDGGHVGRHPGTLIELLLDLLPLRLLYSSRAVEPPPAIDRAIDRMMPMLRFFRHGSGDLALFNGMGATPIGDLATVLAHDSSRGMSVKHAVSSGYDRLEAGATVVIAETGAPPPLAASAAAHAGCLSFEMSSGPNRVVVNCGAPARPGPAREAARLTAAHSTLILNGASSGVSLEADGAAARDWATSYLARRLGPVLIEGARLVGAERSLTGERDLVLNTHHDGYRKRYGAIVRRRLQLAADGGELAGEDALDFADGGEPGGAALLRFHLHPAARPRLGEAGDGVLIDFPDGERWRFTCEDRVPQLEASVLFAVTEGRRPSAQIVVEMELGAGAARPVCRWRFRREVATPPVDAPSPSG